MGNFYYYNVVAQKKGQKTERLDLQTLSPVFISQTSDSLLCFKKCTSHFLTLSAWLGSRSLPIRPQLGPQSFRLDSSMTMTRMLVLEERGGMDLAWVLLIWIRSLVLFLCLWFFLIVFLLPTLHAFLCYSFFCIVFLSFFLVFHSFFFLQGNKDITIWRGVHVIEWPC